MGSLNSIVQDVTVVPDVELRSGAELPMVLPSMPRMVECSQ